jgi:hypothetical protein
MQALARHCMKYKHKPPATCPYITRVSETHSSIRPQPSQRPPLEPPHPAPHLKVHSVEKVSRVVAMSITLGCSALPKLSPCR